MSEQIKSAGVSSANGPDLGRSQAIFVAVGISIILGGLFFLAQADGPYHPEMTGEESVSITDS